MSSDDESDPSPLSDIAKMAKGQNSVTLLTQLPSFACSPGTRFDRWVKQFENIANIASWNDEEKISMFTTNMTDKAYDIFQTFWDSCPNADFNLIKESYGNETPDYFQRKFNEYTRRPREPVFDYAHRLKTNFNKCYPPSSSVTADNSNEQQS